MKIFLRVGGLLALLLALWFYYNKYKKSSKQGQEEKVLTIAQSTAVNTLDPIHAYNRSIAEEVSKVYEGLFELHYLKRPYELVPNLAAEMPIVSEDGLMYTFKIRPGVKFQDNACFPEGKGRELVAEDFVFSFKRVADPKLMSKGFNLIDGCIVGLNEWREKQQGASVTNYDEEIEGLKAIDTHTLQIKLTKPCNHLLNTLASCFFFAVPKEAVAHYGAQFDNNPVGTGAFVTSGISKEAQTIEYHKNPNFREKLFPNEAANEYKHMLTYAGKKLPLVDKIVTHLLPDTEARWMQFQQGNIDYIEVTRDVRNALFTETGTLAPDMQEKKIQLFRGPQAAVNLFVFNNAHKLFKENLKLRQAISMAFDREEFNKLFFQGEAMTAQSIVPGGLAGFRAEYVNPNNTYDVEKAKQLLAEAGYPEGKGLPTIVCDCLADDMQKQQVEFFKNCMEKVGIKVQLSPNASAELQKKLQAKTAMMYALALSETTTDSASFLCHAIKGANFEDAEYNELCAKLNTTNSTEHRQVYEQLATIVAERMPVMVINHPLHVEAGQEWLKNFLWSPFIYDSAQYLDVVGKPASATKEAEQTGGTAQSGADNASGTDQNVAEEQAEGMEPNEGEVETVSEEQTETK